MPVVPVAVCHVAVPCGKWPCAIWQCLWVPEAVRRGNVCCCCCCSCYYYRCNAVNTWPKFTKSKSIETVPSCPNVQVQTICLLSHGFFLFPLPLSSGAPHGRSDTRRHQHGEGLSQFAICTYNRLVAGTGSEGHSSHFTMKVATSDLRA